MTKLSRSSFQLHSFLFVLLLGSLMLVAGCDSAGVEPDPDAPSENAAPVADAGSDQTVDVGAVVTLDGSASLDENGDDLTYSWSLAAPEGSSATLSANDVARPTFTADVAGSYMATLTVSDGEADDSDQVVITAQAANAVVEINSNIDTDTVLEDIFTDPAMVDYILTRGINVNAALTIEPGVRIQSESGTRLDVEADGVLVALGTATNPITIEGEGDTPGYWDGIYINSNNPLNELTYVTVSNGGQNGYANLYIDDNAQVKITNSTFRASATVGITAENEAAISGFTSNSFALNANGAMEISAGMVGALDEDSDYGDGQGVDAINVNGGRVDVDQTWPATNVPLLFSGVTDVNTAVTVAPGANLRFASSARLDLNSTSVFKATGTAGKPITLVGDVDTQGYWDGIYVNSNNPQNELRYVVIANGGQDGYANIYIDDDAQIAVNNSTIRMSATVGLAAENEADLAGFANNAFELNANGAAEIPAYLVGALDENSDYADGEGLDAINVYGAPVNAAQTWPATNAPLLFSGVTDVNTAVTVAPGANLRFASSARIDLNADASFKAIGTANEPISFIGDVDATGYWDGIYVNSNNPTNQLSYVTVANGGLDGYANVYVNDNAQVTVGHSTIRESAGCGIFVENEGTLTLVEGTNTFSGNAQGGVCMQ